MRLDLLFHPGVGVNLVPTGKAPANLATSIDWVKFLLDLIPANIVQAMAEQKTLPVLVFTVLFGLALAGIGDEGEAHRRCAGGADGRDVQLTGWIIALSPIAVFGLIAYLFATQGLHTLLALGELVVLEYVGLGFIVVIFWIMMRALARAADDRHAPGAGAGDPRLHHPFVRSDVAGAHRRSSRKWACRAASSRSCCHLAMRSTSTAPRCTSRWQRRSWPRRHVTLGSSGYLAVLITTLIASKGSANIPSGGLVILATVLTAVGLPVKSIALIAGVDAFLDMGRTTVNVFGDTVAAKLVMRFASRDITDKVYAT